VRRISDIQQNIRSSRGRKLAVLILVIACAACAWYLPALGAALSVGAGTAATIIGLIIVSANESVPKPPPSPERSDRD
jgi:hypothetical protein